MSFKSRDLMIDVLPSGKFNALVQPGYALCGQATATSPDEDDDEEEDNLECGQATAGDGAAYAPRMATDLALLQRQLRETLPA